jgi:hypothetical protein
MNTKTRERQEIEELLPWHAAGTLSRRDAQRVEQAIEGDADLARQFELVREEFSETIHLNETLGAPSARAIEKLMADIEKESGPARQTGPAFSLSTWVAETFSALSPRTLTWATAAAALLIVVQAGILGSLYLGGGMPGSRGGYQTASKSPVSESVAGTFVLISFAPTATASDISGFLTANNLAVVDGPRAGGLYRVRIASTALSKDDANTVMGRLRENRGIVGMVLPSE